MGKILTVFLVTILSIVLLLVIGFVVLINLTPRTFGLETINVSGKTLEEMGLADTSFREIYLGFNDIANAKEENIIENPYDEVVEKETAKEVLSNSSLGEQNNYAPVLTDKIIYDDTYMITYSDTTIAYIVNSAIHSYVGDDEDVNYMKDADIHIDELTVDNVNGVGYMHLITTIELGEYKAEIQSNLGALGGILPIPENIFIIADSEFSVDGDGKIIVDPVGITVNGDNESKVSKAIVDVAIDLIQGGSVEEVNEKIWSSVETILNNFGKVGKAEVDSNNKVISEPIYGINGVEKNKLYYITHVE